ncbi:MAG: hypothetical protein Phog2KO_25560 [Phototrophicaceae bacterium]
MEALSNLKKCNNERNKRTCLYDVLRSLDNKYHANLALAYTQHTLDLLGDGHDFDYLQDLIDTSYDVLEQKNNIVILWQKFHCYTNGI